MQTIYAKKYFIYARKSTDSEDKQIASLDDQVHELNKLAERLGLNVVEVIEESQSAKEPGRPLYNQMMKRLKKGEADGILSWKLNRLARNPIDGGQIIWHLQNSFIKHIQTYSSSYTPTDNVLMMYIEFGMANQFVNDLSVDTVRGMRRKAEKGWYPQGVLPIGYMHNKGEVVGGIFVECKNSEKEIIPHPERYSIVKTLWDYLLTGSYSIADLKRIGDKKGLRNRNDKTYSFNSYTNMFKKEFYCGYYYWKNDEGVRVRIKGKHKAMISELDYLKAQELLGNRTSHSKRERKYCFPLRGLITCGECNGHVTAEHKYQIICTSCKTKFSGKNKVACPKCFLLVDDMKNKSVVDKIYYRCTRNYGVCKQPGTTNEVINCEVNNKLDEFMIDTEFYHFFLKALKQFNDENSNDKAKLGQLKQRISELETRIENLSIMCADGDISKEQFKPLQSETNKLLMHRKKELLLLDKESGDWFKMAKDATHFLHTCSQRYQKLRDSEKTVFMRKFASNLILKDKSLEFIGLPSINAVRECHLADIAQKSMLRT